MPVYFAPPQQRLWKVWVVYRIRQELRLKTHGAAGLIYRPILSAAPGQPVGRIQLHTGRGGVHRHGDAAAVAPQHRRTAQTGPVHAEMVVIAVHQPQLLRVGQRQQQAVDPFRGGAVERAGGLAGASKSVLRCLLYTSPSPRDTR